MSEKENRFRKSPKDTTPTEIHQPPASGFQGPSRGGSMIEGKAKLDNPRVIIWGWILSYLVRYRRSLAVYISLLLIVTLISAFNPLLQARIIDLGINRHDPNILIIGCVLYFGCFALMAIGNYFVQRGMGILAQKVVYNIRSDIFDHFQRMSLAYFERKMSGEIISIGTNDVDQLNQLVGGQFVQLITAGISLLLSVISMYILNSFLATLSLGIFPIFITLTLIIRRLSTAAFKESRKTIGKITSSIQENVAGARVVQAFGQEQRAATEFEVANKENYRAMLRIRRIFGTFFPFINFLTTSLTVAILLTGGLSSIGRIDTFGTVITVGVLTGFITYLADFFRPFMTLMEIQQIIEAAMAASDRIYSLLHESVEISDPSEPVSFTNVQGAISFTDVSFGYNLNGISTNASSNGNTLQNTDSYPNNVLPSLDILFGLVKNLNQMLQPTQSFRQNSGSAGLEKDTMGGSNGFRGKKDPLILAQYLAKLPIPQDIFAQFPPKVQEIVKEQRTFLEYAASQGYIIEHLNISIPAGITLAIVGETGAGKTTLIKLLARFYDVSDGSIQIDGIDIRRVLKKELRKIIKIVPQDSFVFSGTIRDNILYGFEDSEISPQLEQRMRDVSQFLGLHNFIAMLPDQYESMLKENGMNISIGQRQLIAFARALILDPKILILDEATSSVDPFTESLIQDALDRARAGRTTIIIAHRLSTIKNADLIVVIGKENHGILEQGIHEELIQKNGTYKRFLEMQDVQSTIGR